MLTAGKYLAIRLENNGITTDAVRFNTLTEAQNYKAARAALGDILWDVGEVITENAWYSRIVRWVEKKFGT